MSLASLLILFAGFLAAVPVPEGSALLATVRNGSTNESPVSSVWTPEVSTPVVRAAEAGEWVANSTDNICGLRDLGQLSNPARVDHPKLLKATPELQKLRDEKIDPHSPAGIQLREKAIDRVRAACEKVRAREGICSVWRAIRHRDGRQVSNLTEKVLGEL